MAGCVQYAPQPLDLPEHVRQWQARDPAVAEVRQRMEPPAAFAIEDGLQLLEAEAVALVFNADLRMARLRVGIAQAGADHAGAWDDPVLGFDAERILNDVAEPWVSVGRLQLTIPISGRLGAARDAAVASRDAALLRVAAEEWRVRADLRSRWHRWSAAGRQVELLAEHRDQLARLAPPLEQLAERGELGRFELLAFRLAVAETAAELQAVQVEAEGLRGELLQTMGLAPGAAVELVPDLTACPLPPNAVPAAVAAQNPDLAVLAADYAAAEQDLRVEIARQWPDLGLVPGFGSDENTRRAYLGFTLPIPLWNANRESIAAAQARRELARAAVETGLEATLHRLASARRRLAAATAIRGALDRDLRQLLVDQQADIAQFTAAGRLGPLALTTLVAGDLRARQRLLAAELEECLAAAAVLALTGVPADPGSADAAAGSDR